MRKLSIVRCTIITLLIFPFSNNAQAEYFFVYGPPAPVINAYNSGCGCGVRRVYKRCHPVRRVHRRCSYRPPCSVRPRCHARPRCCARTRPCCPRPPDYSSVTVQYFCPPPRPVCGYGVPLDESYAGGGCRGGCGGSSGNCDSGMDPGVSFAQPADCNVGAEMPCYTCNQDLATGDDDPCNNPDMQINY